MDPNVYNVSLLVFHDRTLAKAPTSSPAAAQLLSTEQYYYAFDSHS